MTDSAKFIKDYRKIVQRSYAGTYKTKWLNSGCPVCKSCNFVRADFDFPETMLVCEKCGSEWNKQGDILLNARDLK